LGVELFLVWNENGKEKHKYIFKISQYPSELFYTQNEIPDGKLPENIDVKYLPVYQAWLEKLLFVAVKLPKTYMQLNTASQTYDEILASLREDIQACENAFNQNIALQQKGMKTELHVG
jgi:hypothetical protein